MTPHRFCIIFLSIVFTHSFLSASAGLEVVDLSKSGELLRDFKAIEANPHFESATPVAQHDAHNSNADDGNTTPLSSRALIKKGKKTPVSQDHSADTQADDNDLSLAELIAQKSLHEKSKKHAQQQKRSEKIAESPKHFHNVAPQAGHAIAGAAYASGVVQKPRAVAVKLSSVSAAFPGATPQKLKKAIVYKEFDPATSRWFQIWNDGSTSYAVNEHDLPAESPRGESGKCKEGKLTKAEVEASLLRLKARLHSADSQVTESAMPENN